jgi:ribosomal protein S18 acetylase RimI-like enzyme
MKFTIREALPTDSNMLIELTRLTPIQGIIGLIIDRKPNFFDLLKQSGVFIVLVAVDDNNMIRGCFVATKEDIRLKCEETSAYYLRDLKVHPDYRGSKVAFMLVKKMYERLKQEGADILYCTSAAGNASVMPFFEGRAGIPKFTETSTFNVYQILPRPYSGNETATVSSIIAKELIEKFFNRYTFRPASICNKRLVECTNFSIIEGQKVTATIGGFDVSSYKQNVVTSYSIPISALLMVLRFLKPILKLSSLPQKNKPLNILYVRYYGFKKGKQGDFKIVLKHLCNYAFENKYHFVSFAVDEKDIDINKLIKPFSQFNFRSSVMVTSLLNSRDKVEEISRGVNYEDYALV